MGEFAINEYRRHEAFVRVAGLPFDVKIDGFLRQSRAVHGDVVATLIDDRSEWDSAGVETRDGNDRKHSSGDDDSPTCESSSTSGRSIEALALACREGGGARPTGIVVGIVSPSSKRASMVGHLEIARVETIRGVREAAFTFVPVDSHLPRAHVSAFSMPRTIVKAAREAMARGEGAVEEVIGDMFVRAKIRTWSEGAPCPIVDVIEIVGCGTMNDLDVMTKVIVAEHAIVDAPFSDAALACLPVIQSHERWEIPKEEFAKRKDFRDKLVFSIDPPSARDLDDALHVTALPNGSLNVGVHIADVSHFVAAHTALDEEAKLRGTTTYLVHTIFPMLPRLLCENLCSLNPGVERLTFSVEWEMTRDGVVKHASFTRGVIKSAAKLSYGHVQHVIDAGADVHKAKAVFDAIEICGEHSAEDIIASVKLFDAAAKAMRKRRFDQGAVRLDQPKVSFELSDEFEPLSAGPYVIRDSNRLVEEFMLLANMTVAEYISSVFPTFSLLRCHAPPNERKLGELETFANDHDIAVDTSSSKTLHDSLRAIADVSKDVFELVQLLATKPMQLAKYFCTGSVREDHWAHYALAVPYYTHFTSPIRRYPDIVVHRLLAAAMYYDSQTGSGDAIAAAVVEKFRLLSTEACQKVAEHCNSRKLASKYAQERSQQVFLCKYLERHVVITDAIVRQLGTAYIVAYLPEYGMEIKIYLDKQRHLVARQKGAIKGKSASTSVEIALKLRAETLEAMSCVGNLAELDRAKYKSVLKHSRGLRGRCLNTTEEQERAIEEVYDSLEPKLIELPVTLNVLDKVQVILCVQRQSRVKNEIHGLLLIKTPVVT